MKRRLLSSKSELLFLSSSKSFENCLQESDQCDYLSIECFFSVDCIALRLLRQHQEFSWLCSCLLELLQETEVPFELISSPCFRSLERPFNLRPLLFLVVNDFLWEQTSLLQLWLHRRNLERILRSTAKNMESNRRFNVILKSKIYL